MPGQRVLDVGTGTGKIAHALERHGCRVEGIDKDEAMLAEARRTSEIVFRCATAEETGAADSSFDTVIAGHTTSGPLTWQDFVNYGEFNKLFLEHARKSLQAGKTAEQAMADLKLPDKFKDYNLQGGRGGPGGNFNVIYQELQNK